MQVSPDYSTQPWFQRLEARQQELLVTAFTLYEREPDPSVKLVDYSFIVFPAAKAYEGFLKKYLFTEGLIDEGTFQSRRFRIGRALNPDVAHHQRDDQWLFDDVIQRCGRQIADQVWATWLECRNHVFHYFPTQESAMTLEQAGQRVTMVVETIQAVLQTAAAMR